MKLAYGIVVVGVMAIGLCAPSPARAQGMPSGSYQRSCSDAHVENGFLVAVCRSKNGNMRRSSLPNVRNCAGDIGNNDGNLQCSYASGGAAPAPRPGGQAPNPGYGGNQSNPGYGGSQPNQGYGGGNYGQQPGGYGPNSR